MFLAAHMAYILKMAVKRTNMAGRRLKMAGERLKIVEDGITLSTVGGLFTVVAVSLYKQWLKYYK